MSTGTAPVMSWGRKQWLSCITTICAVQLALLFWLSNRQGAMPATAPQGIQVHFSGAKEDAPRRALQAQTPDPTLFALVSPVGFSRSAWLTIPRFAYPRRRQPGPAHYLSLAPDDLASDFAEFVQTNLLDGSILLDRLAPAFTEPKLTGPGLVNATALKIEGPLEKRQLLANQRLPQQAVLILTNTVVHVLIDSTGATVSAALTSSCGIPSADQDALRFARTARFASSKRSVSETLRPTAGLTFGNLVFKWSQFQWDETTAANQP